MRNILSIPKTIKSKLLGSPIILDSIVSKNARIDKNTFLFHSTINDYSYVGTHTTVNYAIIGKFCSISNFCAIGSGEHPTTWVSSSPVFNSTDSILPFHFSNNDYCAFRNTSIGNDVWIGTHCLIKSGINIADGAVIGMGSVITKDIGPYEVWVGNPGKMIKKRFDDLVINELLSKQWWNMSTNIIKENSRYFNNVDNFLDSIR
ncbi:acetyltransferase [Clostridia bacterium]|nr:acetyltransferase [Clostridia bacterium]